MKTGFIIKAEGTMKAKDFLGSITLKELQSIVGGLIEIVDVNPDFVLVVNEEGLLHDLAFNHLASIIASRKIVGNALLIRRDEIE